MRNIPLPEPHLLALGVSALLHRVWPRRTGGGPATDVVGASLVAGGAGLAGWATLAAGDTDLEHPDRLVARGPYAVSRNPMYVGWTLTYVGSALLARSQWPLLLLPGVAVATHRAVLAEEHRLGRGLGPDYRAYSHRVRRYV